MATGSKAKQQTAPIRIFDDSGALLAQGEVPLSMLRGNPDRAALLKALQAPKRAQMSTSDPLAEVYTAQGRKARRDSLEDIAQRLDAVEQRLQIGRYRQAPPLPLPAELTPPPAA